MSDRSFDLSADLSAVSAPHLRFSVPLTLRIQRFAQAIADQLETPIIAEQAYRNILAVYAANFYCQCMNLETNLGASLAAWSPALHVLQNYACLSVVGLGEVECCPIAPETDLIELSWEALGRRAAYLAIELNLQEAQAHLIGFLPYPIPRLTQRADWLTLDAFLDAVYPAFLDRVSTSSSYEDGYEDQIEDEGVLEGDRHESEMERSTYSKYGKHSHSRYDLSQRAAEDQSQYRSQPNPDINSFDYDN